VCYNHGTIFGQRCRSCGHVEPQTASGMRSQRERTSSLWSLRVNEATNMRPIMLQWQSSIVAKTVFGISYLRMEENQNVSSRCDAATGEEP